MDIPISQESLLYYVNNFYEVKISSKPVLGMPDKDVFKSNSSLTMGQRFRHFVVAMRLDLPIFPVYLFLS